MRSGNYFKAGYHAPAHVAALKAGAPSRATVDSACTRPSEVFAAHTLYAEELLTSFFHARSLSISNGSFILNVMINSFHPKGLGGKKKKKCLFCFVDSRGVGMQDLRLLHRCICSLSANTHTHQQAHTHSIDQQPLGTNLALCVH